MAGEPIRIAHVIGKLNKGGVEAVINNYYRHIDHDKYQFDYIIDEDGACQPSQEMIDLGARYFVVPPYQNLFSHIAALTGLYRENHYRIVHSSMNTLAVFSLFAAWLAGVPIRINHSHSTASKGDTKRNAFKYILRPFAKVFANSLLACSRYSAEWLFGKRAMRSGKVTIVNNAIDIQKYAFDPEIRHRKRDELGIQDELVVGHVGRFCFQKNHEFLIDVFKRVLDYKPTSKLILIGIGELQEEIYAKVEKLGILQNVLFLGARDDVCDLYQCMDIFVLPSRYEGLPVVGIEAQAAGLPCVFSDQITEEVIVTRETSALSLSDPDQWAETILSKCESARRMTTEDMQAAGFDIRIEAKKLEAVYERLKGYNKVG